LEQTYDEHASIKFLFVELLDIQNYSETDVYEEIRHIRKDHPVLTIGKPLHKRLTQCYTSFKELASGSDRTEEVQ